ncbi:MAG TPA: septum formation initiator [Stellaceae bacterium]|nr:septum formation initiator [Stellaceae bacterium]
MRRAPLPTLLALLLVLAPALHAQEQAPRQEPPRREQGGPGAQTPAPPHRTLLPADSVTQHEIMLGGKKLAYNATAGTIDLKDAQGETTAEVFYVSFTLANAGDAEHRPVTYLFNGGPGAASAYLDIGAVGPRVLTFPGDGAPVPASLKVVDNPDTWLPFTDLVFIDPVGTGFSRALDPEKAQKEFWGVKPDIDALGNVIRLHLAKTGRLTSPVYLAGESYGGFRVSRLAEVLATEHGVAPAGVIMVSPIIDFGLAFGGPLGPLPWALRLPSYAAVGLGDKALDKGALDEVEEFALHDYLVMLVAGPSEGEAAKPIYDKIAQFTGLDPASVAKWRGRIPVDEYLNELHQGDGRVLSRYDGRVSEVNPNPWSFDSFDDPVLDGTIGPFTSAFVAYSRDELGFKTDQPFELLNRDVSRHWDWGGGHGTNFAVSSSDSLRKALALQPKLKVMIAHGVSDLETPYMMSRYIRDHMPGDLGQRVALKLYLGGHMLYLRPQSRDRLHADAAQFYGAAMN